MPLISNIRTVLSGVAAKFADGYVEIRTLTSAPNATPRTYSAWATIPNARCCDFNETQVQTEDGTWLREETCSLRIPYLSNVSPTIRDQIRQGPATGVGVAELVWSVRNQVPNSAGSVGVYTLARRTPMLQNPRQGGI